ncbi:MAG TPA: hypothetical protein PKO06_03800, partial [Candidatus Ozemobacteraceae bacterium]|nr:hypothetical protein [Candidatus Ozemobacteraceae bacterium]
ALSLLVCCLVIGHRTSPVLDQISTLLFAEVSEMNSLYEPIESRIPPDASVSAPHHLAARLCTRRRLWFFPQGADEADYVIIPHMPLSFPAVTVAEAQQCQARLMQSGRYEQMGDQEFFTVLRRRPAHPDAGAANRKGTP